MKKYLIVVFALIFNIITAQDKICQVPMDIGKKSMVFEIVDSKSKELLLCQKEEGFSTVYKTDDKFKVIDTLYFQTPHNYDSGFYTETYTKYLGHSKKNENYSLYWSASKIDSVFYQQIDFNTNVLKSKRIFIDFKKEVLLESIAIGSKFYMISVAKKGNSLIFRQFDEGEYEKKTIDFAGQVFYHSQYKNSDLIWDVFNDGIVGVGTISEDMLVSLPLTQNLKKLYIRNDKEIIFTFDGNAYFTQILKINIDDFSYTLQNIEKSTKKPVDEFERLSQTNSFLCNDKLFQIIASTEAVVIDIKNSKFETVKSYKIEKDKEIDFINTEVFQENGSITTKKAVEKSSTFVKNLNKLHLGLTCQFKDNTYHLTIGGYGDVDNSSNAMMYGAMFGVIGAVIAVSLAPSYAMQSINSYSGRMVVYTNSILDENLNHTKVQFKESAFDKLRTFVSLNTFFTNPMAFKLDKTTYFGGYNKNTKSVSFHKFEEK